MKNRSSQFEGMLSRYFERVLEDNPMFATMAGGLPDGEGHLGRLTPDVAAARQRRREKALRELETVSPRDLSAEQQLDRLAWQAQLLRECEDYQRGRPGLEPAGPAQVLDILFHELQRGDDHPARAARNLRSLLREAPEYLEGAAGLLKQPETVWLRVMEQVVAGADALLDGVRQLLARRNPHPRDAVLISAVRRAMAKYARRAQSLSPAPAGSFAIGPGALQRRVRDELGLDCTLGQVESVALGETARIHGLLKEACRPFGRNRTAESILGEVRANWRPRQPLLELYRKTTLDIAEGFRQAKAVTFPVGDELRVKPVPEFLRTLIPTAAYSQPGAFARRQRGVFWVNDLSVLRSTAAEKQAEVQQHFGVGLTCAHEAYPGHHLQFVTANEHPRRWRRLFAHAVFYEGWTLWCEQMLVDLRIERSPWTRVQQLHDALWRAHRILVDLRLQTGRYPYAAGVQHLRRHLGFTRARAEAEINWYTGQPAVPMSYWLGRLENERLRQRLMTGRGWSLQRFNDWLLSFGTLPQSWLEKYGLD